MKKIQSWFSETQFQTNIYMVNTNIMNLLCYLFRWMFFGFIIWDKPITVFHLPTYQSSKLIKHEHLVLNNYRALELPVCNKADFILAFASHASLHALALTETWIRPENTATPSTTCSLTHPAQTSEVVGQVCFFPCILNTHPPHSLSLPNHLTLTLWKSWTCFSVSFRMMEP